MIWLNRIVSIVSWHCLCHEHTFPNWFTSLWGVYPLNWLVRSLLKNLGFEANPTMIRILSTDQLNQFSSSIFLPLLNGNEGWRRKNSNWSKKVSSSRLNKLCQVVSQIIYFCGKFDHILVTGQATENWKVGADEDQLQVLENTKQERKGGRQYQNIWRGKNMFVLCSD